MKKLATILLIFVIVSAIALCACGEDTGNTQPSTTETTSPVQTSEPDFEAELDDLSDIDVLDPTEGTTTDETEESTSDETDAPTTTPTTKPTTPSEDPTVESKPSDTDQENVPSPTDSDGRIVLPMIPG